MGTKNVNKQLETIRNSFPVKFSEDVVYNLLNKNIEVVYNEKLKSRKYYLDIIDNYGYKHRTEYHQIKNGKGRYTCLNRFFLGNPYTYDNINLYCKLNNIDLHIDGTNLPVNGASREKMDYIDSKGNIHNITWNQVQHYTFQYQEGYEDVKAKRKSERELSKQDVVNIVIKMQKRKGSPLDVYDFYPKQKDGVGIRTVRKFWGELWLMQKELGMKITGKHGNILSDEDTIKEINDVCNRIKTEENRSVITYNDFRKYGTYADNRKYAEVCRKLKNCSFREYINSLGYELQKAGNGMNYKFDDGEVTTSLYEYEFSRFLRSNNILFNESYFRNIPYKSIDNSYNGNMNCDYLIIFNNKKVYIELAGILGNKGHQEAYRNNTPIKSKSKELYRQKLYQKRDIFERNGLDYYILLKDEMNEETYKNILNKYLKEVA